LGTPTNLVSFALFKIISFFKWLHIVQQKHKASCNLANDIIITIDICNKTSHSKFQIKSKKLFHWHVWFLGLKLRYIQTKHNSILKLHNKWKQQVIQCKKIGCCFRGWGGIDSKSKGCSRSANLSRYNNSKRKSIGNFNKFDFKFVFFKILIFSNTCTLSKNDQSFPQSYSWMSSSCGNSFSWPSWIPSLIKNSNFKSIEKIFYLDVWFSRLGYVVDFEGKVILHQTKKKSPT